jgi:rhodanese-related sulfurtransferase
MLFFILLCGVFANAQFKADNVKYTTVFPEDLCKTLSANKGAVLLDVRSKGEYDDTSSSVGLNIGHFKNTLHIDIRELPQRWKELSAYKDQPLFIYCSHSQRSRRASRLLADSGFTRVHNINGGLTDFYKQGLQSNPCEGFAIETSVPYKIISAKQLADATRKGKSYYIIDLRSDSIFRGLSTERTKVEGKFTGSVNLPFDKFPGKENFAASKPILLVDEFGGESPKAAKMLTGKGIKDVTILLDGMDGWVDYIANTTDKPIVKWSSKIGYHLLSGEAFNKLVNDKQKFTLIDLRTKEEFNNSSKNYWQNIGQIKNAINIPFGELKTSTLLPPSASDHVIVYGFNSQPEIFEAAKWLKDLGYRNVSVLQGGIWKLRWASHNLKGKSTLEDLVINVPPENQ